MCIMHKLTAQVKNQINQVIAKLQRKKKNIDAKTMEHFIDMSGGMDPTQFVVDIQKRSPEDAKKRLLAYYDLFRMLQESKPNGGRPVVISDKQDTFIEERRGYGNKDARPEDYIDAFSSYIQNNINCYHYKYINLQCLHIFIFRKSSFFELKRYRGFRR